MKAAVIDRFGGPEEIYYTDIEKPVPGPDSCKECLYWRGKAGLYYEKRYLSVS